MLETHVPPFQLSHPNGAIGLHRSTIREIAWRALLKLIVQGAPPEGIAR